MTASDHLGQQWPHIEDHPDPYNPKGRVKLATETPDGRVIGRIRYDPTETTYDHPHQPVVHINHIGVEEGYQGQGVARALYRSVREDHPDRPILHHVDDQSRDGNGLTKKLTKEDPKGHLWLHFEKDGSRSYKRTPPRRRPPETI